MSNELVGLRKSDGDDYNNTLSFTKHTTSSWLFLTVLFSFLTVVGSGSIAVGGLLNAANGGGMTTVRSYTNAAGREGISTSGAMRADSWVTLPSEIPARAGHLQIEKILEIQPGRGSHYLDFQVPTSNLRVPANGTKTSGGALQFQLNNPVPINPSTFRRPPGRPGGC